MAPISAPKSSWLDFQDLELWFLKSVWNFDEKWCILIDFWNGSILWSLALMSSGLDFQDLGLWFLKSAWNSDENDAFWSNSCTEN